MPAPDGPGRKQPSSIQVSTSLHSPLSRWERAAWLAMLGVINLPLAWGLPIFLFRFDAELVARGEYWRLATHAFAHVGLYHLFLDGVVFHWLLAELRGSPAGRLATVLWLALCGLVGAWAWHPGLEEIGLAGLSGVCHGMGWLAGLEWASRSTTRQARLAGYCWSLVCLIKPVVEILVGSHGMASMHLGDVGTPVPECHLGGALGGVVLSLARLLVGANAGRRGLGPRQDGALITL